MKTHPFLLLSACCLLAAHTAHAATMASQPWVTNRIAEAEARTDAKIAAATNAIPAPGDYATVSNRAMSALQSHQPLTPATNYTDLAVSALGSELRGTIAKSAQASTNYTDAVAAEFEDGRRTVLNSDNSTFAQIAYELGDTSISYTAQGLIRESTNAAISVAASKQDALPYPTNAIPYSAISGAPSGGPEWTISVQDGDFIGFVTNGMARVRWWNSAITDISDMSAWPDGAAMFVRFEKQEPITSWGVAPRIHLVGYGTWPTNNFQSVWWRSGTNIFVNILLEE